MTAAPEFRLRIWGMRGTIPAPLGTAEVEEKLLMALAALRGAWSAGLPYDERQLLDLVRTHVPFWARNAYGGNTTCLELLTPAERILVDAGSGLREASSALLQPAPGGGLTPVHLLLTHAHWDHLCGLPFCDAFYQRRLHVSVHAAARVLAALETLLHPDGALAGVVFPVTYEQLAALQTFHAVSAGERYELGTTRVTAWSTRHPGGALAYKFERGARAVVVATDHELADGPDLELADFARQADLLYLDAQYSQAEYDGVVGLAGEPPRTHRGWGHGAWEACLATGLAAGARRIVLGHHDPQRSDRDLDYLQERAQQRLQEMCCEQGLTTSGPEVTLAREGAEYVV